MKYIAAYMLAKLGGKENPKADDIKEIIESVGTEYEYEKAEEICSKLNEKDINKIIKEGTTKLTEVSKGQTTQEQQQQQLSNETRDNDDDESQNLPLELGIVFDDLFN